MINAAIAAVPFETPAISHRFLQKDPTVGSGPFFVFRDAGADFMQQISGTGIGLYESASRPKRGCGEMSKKRRGGRKELQIPGKRHIIFGKN
jgi:hypothetical protein